MYKIGELSKLCRLPVKTLRYYDSEGLLIPDAIDKFTGYRYYSAARLADCNRIVALKELGFTLDEIRAQLNAEKSEDILMLIEAKQAELNNAIVQTESQLRRLEAVKQIIIEGEKIMFNIVIRSMDTIRVASKRKIYKTKNDAIAEIETMKSALPKNIIGKRMVIINYETEYREIDFDLAVCVELEGKLPSNSGYTEKVISLPSDVATLVCKKSELEEAYRAMTREFYQTPAQIIGAFYEIYYEDDTVELKVPVCRLSNLGDNHRDDDVNIPFVNDPDAIGRWKFLDSVPSEEQFSYGNKKSDQGAWLDNLYFLPGGEWFWVITGWTKGYLFTAHESNPKYTYRLKYTIREVDEKKLMFVEMKHYGTESRGGMPEILVYEKVDDREYTKKDIRIRDNTDYPFITDDNVIGKWTVRDIVRKAEDFDAAKQSYSKENLFFLSVEFLADGKCIHTTKQQESCLKWTKGLILNKASETTPAYEIKTIDGKDYLFVEWKSGDYQFGGRKPAWYIFTRA